MRANASRGGGSRFLYEPFDAAHARIEVNERIAEERWALLERRPHSAFIHQLLAASTPARDAPSSRTPTASTLVDPLSDRELDVLRLLASDLDGPAIARRLVVSLNTVKTHTKHIYTKLGVNTRRAAVERARELGLL